MDDLLLIARDFLRELADQVAERVVREEVILHALGQRESVAWLFWHAAEDLGVPPAHLVDGSLFHLAHLLPFKWCVYRAGWADLAAFKIVRQPADRIPAGRICMVTLIYAIQ
jgi:hypothetical protein